MFLPDLICSSTTIIGRMSFICAVLTSWYTSLLAVVSSVASLYTVNTDQFLKTVLLGVTVSVARLPMD